MAYDPDLFKGAAAFYDRFRAPYAQEAIDFAVARLGLNEASQIVDLGCGPGTLARRFAPRVARVMAMDVDPDMLAEGRRLADLEGIANIDWLNAGSAELGQLTGPYSGAVMGQSFHWMDRDQVLRDFHRLIVDGGGIALVNPGRRRPQESWEPIVDEVVERFLGKRRPHPQRNVEFLHEPALLRSDFEATEESEFSAPLVRDIRSVVGMVFSISSTTPQHFGDRLAAFEAELVEALRGFRPDGVFRETVETQVMIAMKR